MANEERVLRNSEILSIDLGVPTGHRHLRATLELRSGERLVLQEATVAALVRAFTTLKTHPRKTALRLVGREMEQTERKNGFAAWQLLEAE